jgi:shikimate dehydrogenase
VGTPALDRYAVIGHPVRHSMSPRIHAAFAKQTGHPLDYGLLDAPAGGFADCVRQFIEEGGRGLNVTLPFKRDAFAFASRHSPRASRAAAVNTLGFDSEGIWGDNTDGVGLVRDLARIAIAGGPPIAGSRILIIGAGGAVRGILGPLMDLEPSEVAIANRSIAPARALQSLFADESVPLVALSLADLPRLESQDFDIVIHATPLSLEGEVPAIPAALLRDADLVYDLSYGRGAEANSTSFLRYAGASGARLVADGLGMLIEQAAESFFVWRGLLPETEPVRAQLRADLVAN